VRPIHNIQPGPASSRLKAFRRSKKEFDMLKPIVSGAKMLAVLVVLLIFGTYHFPVLLFVIPLWYVWLLAVLPDRRKRIIATSGFGLTVIGYWCDISLWHYFASRVEMSHLSEDGRYWAGMAVASQEVANVLILSGLLVFAYADYLRSPKLKQAVDKGSSEKDTNTSQVWPPAPKLP
jgi:hypothetical protein